MAKFDLSATWFLADSLEVSERKFGRFRVIKSSLSMPNLSNSSQKNSKKAPLTPKTSQNLTFSEMFCNHPLSPLSGSCAFVSNWAEWNADISSIKYDFGKCLPLRAFPILSHNSDFQMCEGQNVQCNLAILGISNVQKLQFL